MKTLIILILILLVITPFVVLYLLMKSERFYKWNNLMGIFFLILPFIFLTSIWIVPFFEIWQNATFYQFMEYTAHEGRTSRLYILLAIIIIWLFFLWYMQMKKYTHWLVVYIVSIFLFASIPMFIQNSFDAIVSLKASTDFHMYWFNIGAIIPIGILILAITSFFIHSFIYIRKVQKSNIPQQEITA